MGYCIANNYSFLNNNYYENKSSLIKAIDLISTPARCVLGGRNIDVLSQTFEDKTSVSKRVAIVFFSVIVFPVAAISITALLIKLATFPHKWEKKIVVNQTTEVSNYIKKFQKDCEAGSFATAIESYKAKPALQKRTEVTESLINVIKHEINKLTTPWSTIQESLSLLSEKDAISSINYAVKVRLSSELESGCFVTSANDITSFVEGALVRSDWKTRISCYTTLISDALQVEESDIILPNAVKMYMGDHLLKQITILRQNFSSAVDTLFSDADELLMRDLLFKAVQCYSTYRIVFKQPDHMKEINARVENLLHINRINLDCSTRLNESFAQNSMSFEESMRILGNTIHHYVNSGIQLNQQSIDVDLRDLKISIQKFYKNICQLGLDAQRDKSVAEFEQFRSDTNVTLENDLHDLKLNNRLSTETDFFDIIKTTLTSVRKLELLRPAVEFRNVFISLLETEAKRRATDT